MKTKPTRSVIAVLFVVCTALMTISSVAQELQPGDSSRGEEYFLIRTLEALYEQWPQDFSEPAEFAATTAELRREAIRLKVRAERANLHPSVIDGFADFVAQLDAFTMFLANIGAIKKAAMDQAVKEELESGITGISAVSSTHLLLSQNENVSGRKTALASLVVGGLAYAVDSWGKASAREEAVRFAVNVEAQLIQDQLTTTLERSKQQFADLSRTRGWGEHEIGWNLSPSHAQAVLEMNEQGDLNGLTAEASRQRSARPRDPFIAMEHNLLQALGNAGDAATLDRLSADSYSLRQLIPEDDVYSEYRLSAAWLAALLASGARVAERQAGAPPNSSERSRRAVELWEEVYLLIPSDPDGQVRLNRALAYASDGDPVRASAELVPIAEILKGDGDFLYACASIYCLTGEYDASINFLGMALLTDTQHLADVRTDPDLADLRKNRREEFVELTTPQWKWELQNGLVFANVSLTNKSAFTLTNVRLISATAGWSPDLAVDFLRPGETKKWGWLPQPLKDSQPRLQLECDQGQ